MGDGDLSSTFFFLNGGLSKERRMTVVVRDSTDVLIDKDIHTHVCAYTHKCLWTVGSPNTDLRKSLKEPLSFE